MTDEERRQSTLCHALRTADCNYNIDGEPVTKRAADEIERLARDLRLAESARDYANDVLAYAKEQLDDIDAEPCKICGGSGQIRYLGRDNSEEVEDCSCRLAQSDAALVELEEKVHFWQGEAEKWMKTVQSIDRTPRPDASAGLREAAEIASEWAGATSSLMEAHLLDALARQLRARAADRSGK